MKMTPVAWASWRVKGPGSFRVVFTFCPASVAHNMKTTQNIAWCAIASLDFSRGFSGGIGCHRGVVWRAMVLASSLLSVCRAQYYYGTQSLENFPFYFLIPRTKLLMHAWKDVGSPRQLKAVSDVDRIFGVILFIKCLISCKIRVKHEEFSVWIVRLIIQTNSFNACFSKPLWEHWTSDVHIYFTNCDYSIRAQLIQVHCELISQQGGRLAYE